MVNSTVLLFLSYRFRNEGPGYKVHSDEYIAARYHCTRDRPSSEPRPDAFKKEPSRLEMLNAYCKNLHIMQQTSSEHDIVVDDFKVGYKVALQIKAPDTGLFALNFYNNINEDNIVLHIVACYN